MKKSLLSLTHSEFSYYVQESLGKGRLHAKLFYEEFFRQGTILGSDPAFNNAKALHRQILALTDVSLLEVVGEKQEGLTKKFLVRTLDRLDIEAVLIPMQAGGTLCVSSQVGCRMGCTFCETGRMGLIRNLTVAEIIAQVFIARNILHFSVRNIVFMGMGEPFDNYEAVMQAVRILNDRKGFGYGRTHITISTSGVIEGIEKLMQEGEYAPNLAVSINAPHDEIRNRLMPINRKHHMQQLKQAMQLYCIKTGRQIMIAYVLLQGYNDSPEQADQLADYLQGLDVKINLIPYNAQSRDRFHPPDEATVQAFAKQLRLHGYQTLLRLTKGRNIMAACGQLGNVKLRQKLRQERCAAF